MKDKWGGKYCISPLSPTVDMQMSVGRYSLTSSKCMEVHRTSGFILTAILTEFKVILKQTTADFGSKTGHMYAVVTGLQLIAAPKARIEKLPFWANFDPRD